MRSVQSSQVVVGKPHKKTLLFVRLGRLVAHASQASSSVSRSFLFTFVRAICRLSDEVELQLKSCALVGKPKEGSAVTSSGCVEVGCDSVIDAIQAELTSNIVRS